MLDSISYCLTYGVQFSSSALFFFANESTKEFFCSLLGGEKAGIGRKPAEEYWIFAGFYVWSVALLKTGAGVWNPDFEYTNRRWWLARTEGGEWKLITWGY